MTTTYDIYLARTFHHRTRTPLAEGIAGHWDAVTQAERLASEAGEDVLVYEAGMHGSFVTSIGPRHDGPTAKQVDAMFDVLSRRMVEA